ncbi:MULTISPECIES: ABC transporter ATP-binding protein [unclassified Arthrobacter]|uniref:ABC transporter ATP-binding protein n=1 Tax=unclassified Arthrobacter TaxID=235627 RepID=UPI001C84541B|nr:ABC transporter ATP-binding protein [Arthrobacter sp. MAHUQ-56]MBX7444629.1 ABC transporter ATP-binding protein [Arthrobacter sp. MAHUQ-56]
MIEIENLTKSFFLRKRGKITRQVDAMKDVNLSIKEGEFFVLLGASGSGKTTTLRCVAGLETATSGNIRINNTSVYSSSSRQDVPPQQRPIAMVFQSYALWPHLDVRGNIEFALRKGARRPDPKVIKSRVDEVLQLLNLQEQEQRPVAQLSGGQQQRVALARALALEPRVLLMDEPLSNLDMKLRAKLRVDLKRITSSLGITTLYVTHDQSEALAMADRVAVMDQGRVIQVGTPTEIYGRPNSTFVGQFLGEMNVIQGELLTPPSKESTLVQSSLGPVEVTGSSYQGDDREIVIGIRPEDVRPATEAGKNTCRATVKARSYLGDCTVWDLDVSGVKVTAKWHGVASFSEGDEIWISLPPELVHIFPGEGTTARIDGPKRSMTIDSQSEIATPTPISSAF